MKKLTDRESHYWNEYLNTLPQRAAPREALVEAGMAGNEDIANELLALYLSGKKTAGSSLLEDYLTAGDPLPSPGRHWIVLDANGVPGCILRTERVERHKFCQVPLRIAIAEGEGDLSLEYWRRCHEEFFRPFLEGWGVKNIESTTVLTEFFQLVYRGQN